MRNTFLIAYDICCPKRYRKIYKVMCGHGDPLQYSVFRCDLSKLELQQLQSRMWDLMKLDEDRLMLVDLGPVEGRAETRIDCWGKPLTQTSPLEPTVV